MFIKAKFKSTCAESGREIKKGDSAFWIKETGQIFCSASQRFIKEQENKNTGDYVQAQEDSYFDNFCQTNNI